MNSKRATGLHVIAGCDAHLHADPDAMIATPELGQVRMEDSLRCWIGVTALGLAARSQSPKPLRQPSGFWTTNIGRFLRHHASMRVELDGFVGHRHPPV